MSLGVKLTIDQVRELGNYLQGTCKSITEGLQACNFIEVDEFTVGEQLSSHSEIELCSECGWWHETNEMNEDGTCNECFPDYED